jgi:hypothetical protein
MKTNTWLHMKWYVDIYSVKDNNMIILGMIRNYGGIRNDMVGKFIYLFIHRLIFFIQVVLTKLIFLLQMFGHR